MSPVRLTLSVRPAIFAVCRLAPNEPIPEWSLQSFFAITRTEAELSIVCPQATVPQTARSSGFEGGWRCLKVEGSLDFALTGILVAIAAPLTDAGISIFAISTYETDYLLVKQATLDSAVQALLKAGHSFASHN